LDFFDHAHLVGAKFTMKTDADTFVFVDRLLSELRGMSPRCLYWGSSRHGHLPSWDDARGQLVGLHSVPTFRWYIPPGDQRWMAGTSYMVGSAYVLSADLVAKISRRTVSPPAYLPEDAVVGALLRPEAWRDCRCLDPRHMKERSSLKYLRQASRGGAEPDALRCEISSIAHGALTIHGLSPALFGEILRQAAGPRMDCTALRLAGKARFPKTAQRPEIYQLALAYRVMVRTNDPREGASCRSCSRDRPVGFRYLLRAMRAAGDRLTQEGFRAAHARLKRRRLLPGTRELVPILWVLQSEPPIPWCHKLQWAVQVADAVADLAGERLLLCDLDLPRVYVNSSSLGVEVSAGRVQWTYRASRRFHSQSPCALDEQCEACFKTSPNESMRWLPEAACNRANSRCWGFDGSSQALAAIHHVIGPLLTDMPDNPDLQAKAGQMISRLTQPRRMKWPSSDDSRASELLSSMEALFHASRAARCVEAHKPSVRVAVALALRRKDAWLTGNTRGSLKGTELVSGIV